MKKLYKIFARLATIIASPVTALVLHGSRRVRVVIIAEGQILLQQTSVGSQKWSLPGGGVEKHENDKAAAVREVAEEVGLVIESDQLVYLGEDYRHETGGRFPRFTRVYLSVALSEIKKPTITRPLEILEAKWFPLSDIPRLSEETLATAIRLLHEHQNQS